MKILHTADWHLGKKLDRFSRLDEQILVMEEIINLADTESVDLVLVAGDLFDNFNPGTEAVELFYKTLKRLSKNGQRPVIAIAGNHDSPYYIDAPDPLARECGIILIGHPKAMVNAFELEYFKISKTDEGFIELEIKNIDFPIRILHTPYANEVRLRAYFGEDKQLSLNTVLEEYWNALAEKYCDSKGVNLLTAHLYMNKKGTALLEEPDGEKPIKIGNADLVYSGAIPPQIQYTALGHLHNFQNIGTIERPVIYSSSPLCYSFSEAGQNKSVTIVTAKPGLDVTFEQFPLKIGKTLERKRFSSVGNTVEWLLQNPNCLVELTLESDTFLSSEERKQIFQAHSGIVHLIPVVKNQEISGKALPDINLGQELLPLFQDYFKSKNNGQNANEDLINLFNEISKP